MSLQPDKSAPSRVELCERARERSSDVQAQIDAAFVCDSEGFEAEAVVFYDAAWNLGIPPSARPSFLIGYGSTLKNVGRFAESEHVLRQALAEGTWGDAAHVFLALTLNASGRSDQAIAELLGVLLASPSPGSGIARFSRAIASYAAELQASTTRIRSGS